MFKTVKRIIAWIGPYKGRLRLGMVCSFFASLFTAVPIITAAWALSQVISDMRGEAPFRTEVIWVAFLVITGSTLLHYLLSYGRALLQDSIGTEVAASERIRIGDILKRVSLGYFEKNSTGEILADLTGEFTQLETNGMKMIDVFVNGYIKFAALVLCLAIFSPPSAMVAVCGALLSTFALRGLNRRSQKSSPINRQANEALTGTVIEYARGLPVVKSFGQEGAAIEALRHACEKSRQINISIEKAYQPWNMLHIFVLKLASVIIVMITAFFTMGEAMTLSYFLMMAMFAFSMFSGSEAVIESAYALGMFGAALDKIDRLNQVDFIDQDGVDVTLSSCDICFDHVSFGYGDNEVIRDVNFTVRQHTTTAFVGPSGGGKTTLCNLMMRFYDVKSGKITVGGHDVREFTCDSLLRNFSMVFQNVYLFRDTIRNNIRFGKPDATENEIVAAAKAACCHDFIIAMPDGYDTMVGEGGSSLSGGEKQRISIARAILKDAPIVILDEATASIDPENEHLIQQALSALTHGKTIITIAHRLATIESADQILVVNHGRIAQQGTHRELMSQKGIYKDFVSLREKAEGWRIA